MYFSYIAVQLNRARKLFYLITIDLKCSCGFVISLIRPLCLQMIFYAYNAKAILS